MNVTCLTGDCGTIDVTLDPIEETFSDFESGTQGFEHFPLNAKVDEWHLSTENANDGVSSWKCGDTGTGQYSSYSDSILVTPIYEMIANSTFSFRHYMFTESGYDGGYLEYKLDGGIWTKVSSFITGSYTSTYREYTGGPPLTNGEPIWANTVGSTGTFARVEPDLSGLTGENISFRFHFFSDSSVVREGWYIDSVNFTTETPSMDKGIIPVGSGTPFYTTAASNPLTTGSLSENQSELITFFVNATGDLDSKYFFFAYANITSNLSIGNRTNNWNVTISVDQELPNITINYPTAGDINDATPVLDIDLSSEGNELWYNIDGGANQTLCSACSFSDDEVLYLREGSYEVNVFVNNPMGEENSKTVSFNVDMNNNYYDSFLDSSYRLNSQEVDFLNGNVTLSLTEENVIDESFTSAEDWILTGGQWQLNSGELIQKQDTANTFAIYNALDLNNITDYNISFDMYAADNDQSGIVFGYEDSSNYYRCRLYQQNNQGGIERISGGSPTTLASATTMYNTNQWNTFLLEIKNKTVSCYINGALTASASDVNFPEGKVGIYNSNNDEVRYDNFVAKITGGKKAGIFTSYSIKLIDTITRFTNITWSEFSNNANNILSVEVSADNGNNWYDTTKNSALSSIVPGKDFAYKVLFEAEDISMMSLLDLNISWTNNISPPPVILIDGINTPREQDFTPTVNVTLLGDASTLLMSIDGRANETICTSCSGSQIFPVILEETAHTIRFYASNTMDVFSTNSISFISDFEKNYFDEFFDNYSIKNLNNVDWNYGNFTFESTSSTDNSPNSCDIFWGFDCGSHPDSDNTLDNCQNQGSDAGYMWVNNVYSSETAVSANSQIQATCEFEPYSSGTEEYMWYFNNVSWTQIYSGNAANGNIHNVTRTIDVGSQTGTHIIRCSEAYYGTASECQTGTYSDNDDLSFEVVGESSGDLTSYSMNTSQPITRISHVSWTENGVSAENKIEVELSVDNGNIWNSITNGGSLSGFTAGSNLIYRILFSAATPSSLSIMDLNVTWESPPTIEIFYPGTYVYNSEITKMNYSISYSSGSTLTSCWYSLDSGATNTTINCGDDITGISSVDGENVWTIYARDSSGLEGQKSVTFSVDTSAPVITFINQTNEFGQIVDSNNPLYEGENLSINVNIEDSSVDSVWVVIWEGVVGGVEKARFFFDRVLGNLWNAKVETDDTFDEKHNYTIYANDTAGLEDSYNGTFEILKARLDLALSPNPNPGSEPLFMTGFLAFSNGTRIVNNAINFWLNGVFIPFENLTNQGMSLSVLDFDENDIKTISNYDNVSYSAGEFILEGSETSGSFTGILDAGARVNWENVSWTSVSQGCSGTVDYQEGNGWGYSKTEDAYITSGSPTTNFGDSNELTIDSSPNVEKSIIKFGNAFGFGENKVPYGSTINSATLRLTLFDNGDNPTFYEILEDWHESEVTSVYRTESSLWGSSGISGSPSRGNLPVGTMSTATIGTKSLDVSSAVSKWSQRTLPNYGLVIDPSGSGGIKFRSSEYTAFNERPRLTVDFTANDCNGVLIYVRTSNDKSSWTTWRELQNGDAVADELGLSRYLEYRIEMGSFTSAQNPRLQDLFFNYTGTFTDSSGEFNYSFITTDEFGSYTVGATSGYRTIGSEDTVTLFVQSGVPPVVSLLNPATNSWFGTSSVNLTYNATDLNEDFKSSSLILNGVLNSINQSVIISGANNFTVNGLTTGVYNWSVNLSDIAITDASETRTFFVDLIKPKVDLIYPVNDSTFNAGFLNLSFKAEDNMDDILSCDVTLDGTIIHTGVVATNNTAINVSSGPLSGRRHFWSVTCFDEVMNNFTSQTWEFLITDIPPTITLISPSDNYLESSGSSEFIYFPEDNSGIDRCELLINGEVNATNYSINLGVNNSFNVSGIEDGIYNWTVRCYDLSNVTDEPVNRTMFMDLLPPIILLVSPANESDSSTSEVNFQFNATDSIDTTLNCSLIIDSVEEKVFQSTSGVISNELFSGLNDGIRNWRIDCTDDSSHTSSSATWTIDVSEAPTVYMNSTNSTHIKGNAIMAEFTPIDNTQITSCSFYLDGVSNKTQVGGIALGALNSLEAEGVADGRHTYYIGCTDGIGLSNVSEVNEIFIDNSNPIITPHFPLNEGVYATNVSFKFEASDSVSPNLICNLTVDSVIKDMDIVVANATNTTSIIPGVTDGTHLWNLTCSDLAGNSVSSTTYNFTKSTAPGVNLISPSNNVWMNNSEFDFSYFPQDDEGFQKAELIINGAVYMENQSAIQSGFSNVFSVDLPDGIYTWSVNVTDITGLIGKSSERIVNVDTSAPILNLKSPINNEILTTNSVDFIFNVTDNIDSEMSCDLYIGTDLEWSGNVTNATTEIANLLLVDGDYSYRVNCSDDALNKVYSPSINFSVVAPPIVNLTTPENNTYTTNSSINFSYIPIDAIGLSECSIYVDDIREDTNFAIVKNVVNNFTVSGIIEGKHYWKVGCKDPDNNIVNSSEFILYRDITPPTITLNSPLDGAGLDANTNAIFNWIGLDVLDTLLVCELIVDGTSRYNGYVANGTAKSESVNGLSVGTH